MRGDERRKIRLQNLRRLRKRFTLEEIAERSGTNAIYLSQICNEVTAGRKSPRALSDAYADKIERGLGLPNGWMDKAHIENKNTDESNPLPQLNPKEQALLDIYRQLPPEEQDRMREIWGAFVQSAKDKKKMR